MPLLHPDWPNSPLPPTEAPPRRLLAVDLLRGLAALVVVFYHLQGALDRGTQTWLPSGLAEFFRAGHFGVNVFFVLSGFVIASSVRDGDWTLGYLWRFAARRSIRLDPPYWVAIALECLLIWVGLRLFPTLATPMPSWRQLLAHLVYAQDILGYGHVLPIFWTLCSEFQFYLALVGLLVGYQSAARRWGEAPARVGLTLAFTVLFLLSVAVHHGYVGGVPRGIALDRWHQFFVGVLAWWVVGDLASGWMLAFAVATVALLGRRDDTGVELAIMVATTGACMLSAQRPDLDRRLTWRPLQFLGTISYSLYLYHASLGWRALSLAQRRYGVSLPPVVGIAAWLGSLVLIVLGVTTLWWLFERPSMRLARHVTLPRRSRLTLEEVRLRGASARGG